VRTFPIACVNGEQVREIRAGRIRQRQPPQIVRGVARNDGDR